MDYYSTHIAQERASTFLVVQRGEKIKCDRTVTPTYEEEETVTN